MMSFDGKVALVTGARSGIGLATARQFQDLGARVFCAQRGEARQFETITADFADVEVPRRVIGEVADRAGRLDILINNAGMMCEGTAEETSLETWDLTLRINLTAPFLLIRHAMPLLRDVRGSIVNVGSIEGLGANPGHGAYCASKAGLHGLTRATAVDHGPEGVRCNAVAPGWIDTDLNVDFIESMPNPLAFRDRLKTVHPVGRTGRPEDVAEFIVWLASDAASFVTGHVYAIDGGRMARLSLP